MSEAPKSPPKTTSPPPGTPKVGSPPTTSPTKPGSSQPSPSAANSPQSSEGHVNRRRSSKVANAIKIQKDVPLRKEEDEDHYTRPDFIYGGPFIAVTKPSPFLDTGTPMNLPLQGTFKKSFAYYSLKERLPVILTKVIDYLSRDGSAIKSSNSASDEDVRNFMQYVTKLKNDLMTNKDYDPLTVDTPNARLWNQWIASQENTKYFNNTWIFTECYVYRRLKEGCELTKGLQNFDYFQDQKEKSFGNNVEYMCYVADRLVTMLPKSDKDKRKNDFITLLKICLWANKCDLSLSLGSQVALVQPAKEGAKKPPPPPPPAKGKKGKKGKEKKEAAPTGPVNKNDPFQMILDNKDKLIVDDTAKIADQVVTKSDNMLKAVNANTTFKQKCSCHRLATAAKVPLCKEEIPAPPPDATAKEEPKPAKEGKEGKEVKEGEKGEKGKEGKEEAPKQIPCPAKMTIPQAVMFDIVCDNAGYELFADLCLAHFLIAQKIVQKVRFHLKNIPWFISDVTPKDFQYVIDACSTTNFSKEIVLEPKPDAPPEGDGSEPKMIKSDNMKVLGQQWNQYLKDGVFVIMAEDYWTYPHVYRDMKKYDYNMYRKLQYAVAIMFKGDLNYRKLLGERNVNPTLGLEASMQGFIPAPIIAVRTVKSELICGLPKGKWDLLTNYDEQWMQTGDYGMIQYCPKGEALKVADRPCMDYCKTCFGVICPEHTDI